jgi:hypothetical protein
VEGLGKHEEVISEMHRLHLLEKALKKLMALVVVVYPYVVNTLDVAFDDSSVRKDLQLVSQVSVEEVADTVSVRGSYVSLPGGLGELCVFETSDFLKCGVNTVYGTSKRTPVPLRKDKNIETTPYPICPYAVSAQFDLPASYTLGQKEDFRQFVRSRSEPADIMRKLRMVLPEKLIPFVDVPKCTFWFFLFQHASLCGDLPGRFTVVFTTLVHTTKVKAMMTDHMAAYQMGEYLEKFNRIKVMECLAIQPELINRHAEDPLDTIVIGEKMFNPKSNTQLKKQHCLDHGDKLPVGDEQYRTLVLHNFQNKVNGKAIIDDFRSIFDFSRTNVVQWIWLKRAAGYKSGFVLLIMRSTSVLDRAFTALEQCSIGYLTTPVCSYGRNIKYGIWMNHFFPLEE